MAEENLFDNHFDSKRCKVCGQFKPIIQFPLDRRDGRRYGPCKSCKKIKHREYSRANPEVQRRATRKYKQRIRAERIVLSDDALRICPTCKIELPLSGYNKDANYKDGYKLHCKTCRKQMRASYRASQRCKDARKRAYQRTKDKIGKEGIKWLIFKSKYGMSKEDYYRMLEEQGGKCAICFSSDPQSSHKLLSVDHCHANGHVRGLLCTPCNMGLGSMKDSIATLQSAIIYLKERGAPS